MEQPLMKHLLLAVIAVVALYAAGQDAAVAREPETRTERVRFERGQTRAIVTGRLRTGESVRYLLRARNGQFLTVDLLPNNRETYFNIFVPGGKLLYEGFKGGNQYRGQLYRTGDHVVEVYYPGGSRRVSRYEVEFVID